MYVRNPLPERKQPLSRAKLMDTLPRVGDKRMERPTIDETTGSRGTIFKNALQPCVVVDVNRAHLWYTVQFENGFRESYKVPEGGGDRND